MLKIPLSIIIITHRSNQLFINSLKSAQFAEEVIVVDNNSHNNWSQLNKYFNFKKIPYPQDIHDFSLLRNVALKHATQNWVFFLDSDEVITPKSQPQIAKIIKQDRACGAMVNRVDIFLDKKMKWGEPGFIKILRMAKRNSMKYIGPIHELAKVNGQVVKSSIQIHHYSHASISSFINKVTLYSLREAQYRYQLKKHFSLFELLIYPPAKFVTNYIFKLGFLDGFRGLVYAVNMSLHSLAVRVYLYEKNKL